MNQNGEKRDRKKRNNSVSVDWLIEVHMLHNAFPVDSEREMMVFYFSSEPETLERQDTTGAETSENSLYLNVVNSFLSKFKKFYSDFK